MSFGNSVLGAEEAQAATSRIVCALSLVDRTKQLSWGEAPSAKRTRNLFLVRHLRDERALFALVVHVGDFLSHGRVVALALDDDFGFLFAGWARDARAFLAKFQGVIVRLDRNFRDGFTLVANVGDLVAGLQLFELSPVPQRLPVLRSWTGINRG